MSSKACLAALASFSLLACFATGCSATTDEATSDSSAAATAAETLVYQHDVKVGLKEVDAAEAELLYKKVFPGGYLRSMEECSDANPTVRIAPSVAGKVQGSFSGIERDETLYIVNVFGCDSAHADNYGTTRYVVTDTFAGTASEVKVRGNAQIPGAIASVNRVLDIDGDGQNEVVITEGYSGMGETSETISLMRFAGNNLVEDTAFADFRKKMFEKDHLPFYVDPCYTTEDPSTLSILFSNIYVKLVDGKPVFRAQKGTLSCPPIDEENGTDANKP